MTTDAPASDILVSWDDVLATTGTAAKKTGLASFAGQTARLTRFADEQRGKKNVRWELTADASVDGETPRRVIVPQHYAERLREKIEQMGESAANLVVIAKVEVSESGSIMLRPTTEKPTPEPAAEGDGTRRRGRPRKTEAATDEKPAE